MLFMLLYVYFYIGGNCHKLTQKERPLDAWIYDVFHLLRRRQSDLPARTWSGGGRPHADGDAGLHDDGHRSAAPRHHGDRARGWGVRPPAACKDVADVCDNTAHHSLSRHRAALRDAPYGCRLIRDRHTPLPRRGKSGARSVHLHSDFLRDIVLSRAESKQDH